MSINDAFSSSIPIILGIVGITALCGFIYKIGEWINKRTAEKTETLKAETRHKADELKEYTNEKWEINRNTIGSMNEKMDKLVARADLVNGNVSNIRTDIINLQEDLAALYETKGEPQRKRALRRRTKKREIEKNRVAQQEKSSSIT